MRVQDICIQMIIAQGMECKWHGGNCALCGKREDMSKEQIWELEENKLSLLKQAYRMKQECPHMSPVGIEYEMYTAIMAEVRDITARLQRTA